MNKRKRQIIHAAQQLFIDKGFNDTSIIDIISAANISKGTFYNHFSSKNECLIAILEETREEALNARYEVALNKDPSDKEVLIKQIALLSYVNRKRNIIQIFESLSGFKDKEIKDFIEKQLILEIEWLAGRLVDVYGEQIREFSYECSVQAIGMIHQSLRIIVMVTKQLAPPETVVKTALDHVEGMLAHLKETKNILFTPDVFQALHHQLVEEISVTKDMLVNQLEGFSEKLTESDTESAIEYSNYLLSELKSKKENLYIIEAVLPSFNRAFINTPHEAEAHEISISIWRYLHKKLEKRSF